MVYMPFEFHYGYLKRYMMRGYTLQLEHHDSVLHPKTDVDNVSKHIVFHINLTHKDIRTALEELIKNRERHLYKGRVESLFKGIATDEDIIALGLTVERLGVEEYVCFLKNYRDGTLTNQYVKRLILPFSPLE